ncbi:MAG: DNA-directed RNA polymerase subunit beta' [Caldiserica bacterium]|nr:DNA-directed RNA polymerase subunit beta' [Caldisericota bacterium]
MKSKDTFFDFFPGFDAIQIGLASPEKIRLWSHGEVKKAETINYRTLKPEPEGLFCERIFGPEKDYECHCGRYKRQRYKGVICERCGVEVTTSRVRRERMGHIELAAPVTHVWFLRGIPSRIALLLDIPLRVLEKVVYFASFIVTDPGDTPLLYKQPLSTEEYEEMKAKYGDHFKAGIGAEAVKELLMQVDLDKSAQELRSEIQNAAGQKRSKAIKRLEVVEALRKSGNRPEWMVIEALPVLPPDLRPLVPLDGGRFATSDLNDLYRRVINRNNRLKKLIEVGAPDIIIRNEKRMLQEAVDALIDNGRRTRPIVGPGNRPLRSLSDMLKGKQGRFRQNLLGKRVDYSGRSVIVVGPKLRIYQCGLPKEMALEMFKPFVMKKIVERGFVHNIKSARRMIERQKPEVWELLEDVIRDHPVLLNRAPTLHRLGIQAFEPVLVEGKAIQIHPLVCTAFNADFDGDQMAVHVPLSTAAQAESRILMLSAYNILSPAHGKPLAAPQRDIIVGCYYLTLTREGDKGEGKYFADPLEAVRAYEVGAISMFAPIKVRIDGEIITTTAGRIIFNNTIRQALGDQSGQHPPFFNSPMSKRELQKIVGHIYRQFGVTKTSLVLDALKDLGFQVATKAGITISIDDFKIPPEKEGIIHEAEEAVDEVENVYQMGLLSDQDRYLKIVEIWQHATEEMEKKVLAHLDYFDPVHMMAMSGARGDPKQVRQIVGMRGLMADPSGRIIEFPIKSSLRDGLTTLEYFISTHGARKGLADTAIKTADAGYLTRRLVDVAQDVVVREEDCTTSLLRPLKKGTAIERSLGERAIGKELAQDLVHPLTGEVLAKDGDLITRELALLMDELNIPQVLVRNKVDWIEITDITEGKNVIEPLEERVLGRIAAEDIVNPQTGEIITRAGEEIDEDAVEILGKLRDDQGNRLINKVKIRSVLTCQSRNSVCAKCYGRDLATGALVTVGEAVGIIAAQSIGEPGTQLTLRTFHTGGIAEEDITTGLPRVEELFEARRPKGMATISEIEGVIHIVDAPEERIIRVTNKETGEVKEYKVSYGARLRVAEGDEIAAGERITEGPLNPNDILRVKGIKECQEYLLQEIQKVYKAQGVDINDKHVELIIRQLLRKVRIDNPGETVFLPGDLVDKWTFEEENRRVTMLGLEPADARPVLLGVTKAALATDSFLSAASFQETTRVLSDAAIKGKIDPLIGLKENVIIGSLIPAGSGLHLYRDLEVEKSEEEEKVPTISKEEQNINIDIDN